MQSIQRTAPSPLIRHLLAATALAANLAAGAASAQTSGAADTSRSTTTTATARDATSGPAQIQRADRKLIDDIAQSNLAEIATGRIALDTSKDERVRKFAQTMIDDHTTAMADVQQLAQAKGVTLPDGPDLKHKTMATALKAMSGETFDRQYMSHAGVGDHQRTLDLLKKTQRDAKDPQLKALAVKMIPVVQAHLDEAHRVAPTAKH